MDAKTLTLEKKPEGILEITLNRPKVHNAFNEEMIQEITEVFDNIERDESVRVVQMQGNGKSFSAGADLNWMKKMKDYSQEENRQDSAALFRMLKVMNECSRPLIMWVHGVALGGGVGLTCVADYVLCSEEAQFGLTEVRLGILPAVISPFVVSKIGLGAFRALLLSGHKIDARRALDIGLVQEVVPQAMLQARRDEMVKEFLAAAPKAQRMAKEFMRNMLRMVTEGGIGGDQVRDYTCETIANLRVGDEAQERMGQLLNRKLGKT